ncbi:MAG: DUF4159 domain-containing protein [Phycisphaeraceae bacterium]
MTRHPSRTRTFTALIAAGAIALALASSAVRAQERSEDNPCGTPPPPKPAQASSAEAFQGMSAPVAPQRRTEKKNPPRPPTIAIKLKSGDPLDWNTDPNDINNLLIWMKSKLEVNFTWEAKDLNEVDLTGETAPLLYRTGHRAFSFTPDQRQRLRDYVMRGGTIIFDTCYGKAGFAESVREEMAQIFPDHPLKQLALDHPVYHAYYPNAGMVQYTEGSGGHTGPAELEGIEVNCRLGVIFSPHDLSCGWDMHTNNIEGGSWIESEYALRLGANIVSYATATRDMGVSLTEAKAYVDESETTMDRFRVGQLIHEGEWRPDEVGLQNLLDQVGQKTALQISFATEGVEPDAGELSRYPFVYMTGHDEFTWSEAQVAAIRRYLANGGFIFADACCGREAFDVAFQREMGKVLRSSDGEGTPLAALPPKHAIYSIHKTVDRVQYTEATHIRSRNVRDDGQPQLLGATVNGRVAVVYSPIALNVGWRVNPVPYAVGYDPESALDLGMNVVMYAMTQ